ncbi:hypothetical protein Glove_2g46 [Diversispora epigaea]|uniref:Uncharacterized protein n=1 Tax=Diversispora epigaea TaxID=1348612 RepID=A0A397JS79_9GLOM|nr:hypothetical protein Glove_2g46 [Diversispora epigaea]
MLYKNPIQPTQSDDSDDSDGDDNEIYSSGQSGQKDPNGSNGHDNQRNPSGQKKYIIVHGLNIKGRITFLEGIINPIFVMKEARCDAIQ